MPRPSKRSGQMSCSGAAGSVPVVGRVQMRAGAPGAAGRSSTSTDDTSQTHRRSPVEQAHASVRGQRGVQAELQGGRHALFTLRGVKGRKTSKLLSPVQCRALRCRMWGVPAEQGRNGPHVAAAHRACGRVADNQIQAERCSRPHRLPSTGATHRQPPAAGGCCCCCRLPWL
jgi:hypothetical protein